MGVTQRGEQHEMISMLKFGSMQFNSEKSGGSAAGQMHCGRGGLRLAGSSKAVRRMSA